MSNTAKESFDSYSIGRRIFEVCSRIKESLALEKRPATVLIALGLSNYTKLERDMSWTELEAIEEAFSANVREISPHISTCS
jgi:hypothetical protein